MARIPMKMSEREPTLDLDFVFSLLLPIVLFSQSICFIGYDLLYGFSEINTVRVYRGLYQPCPSSHTYINLENLDLFDDPQRIYSRPNCRHKIILFTSNYNFDITIVKKLQSTSV